MHEGRASERRGHNDVRSVPPSVEEPLGGEAVRGSERVLGVEEGGRGDGFQVRGEWSDDSE